MPLMWVAAAGTAINIGSQIFSGFQKADAEEEAARAQNEAQERADKYNKQAWEYNKERLKNDFKYLSRETDIKRENAIKNAAFQDNTNRQNWNYDLKIKMAEQRGLDSQFLKSTKLYADQLDLNAASARNATEKEYRRLDEIQTQKSFEFQELQLQTLLKSDAAKSRGRQGKTAAKSEQAIMASRGRNAAILLQSLTDTSRDMTATLREIARDKDGADLAAFAQKMLKPGRLPVRPRPLKTPVPKLLGPRRPTVYDYGPKPVKGYMRPDTSQQIRNSTIASGIGSVANFVGGGFTTGQWSMEGAVQNAYNN